jgi:hypothetical protein
VKEWYNVRRMFDDCLDELRKINWVNERPIDFYRSFCLSIGYI